VWGGGTRRDEMLPKVNSYLEKREGRLFGLALALWNRTSGRALRHLRAPVPFSPVPPSPCRHEFSFARASPRSLTPFRNPNSQRDSASLPPLLLSHTDWACVRVCARHYSTARGAEWKGIGTGRGREAAGERARERDK
jgi:hypothetical protein